MELNETQKEVVNYDGNILLLAQAGTGKTNTLALKMSEIIATKKALPSEILCLTFTNKGCAEISDRIKSEVGDVADKITVKTFHSYCYDLIKRKALSVDRELTENSIFDEDDSALIIKKVAEDTQAFLRRDGNYSSVYRFIDFLKKTAIEREILFTDVTDACKTVLTDFYGKGKDVFNQRAKKIFYGLSGEFTSQYDYQAVFDFVKRYQRELEISHAYDFDDLEYYASLALSDQGFLNTLKSEYRYVFVDEAQDTSFDEYNFIKRFVGDAKICLSGDFYQTIYEWRGSRPYKIIKDFKQTFNPKIFAFNRNYRSSGVIANASFSLLKNMFKEDGLGFDKSSFKSVNVGGEPVYVKHCKNLTEEAKFINDSVKRLNESNSCVLVRTNDYAKNLSKYVDRDRFFIVQDFQYYRRSEVKEITAFLKLILNPYDAVSLERIALKYVNGFGAVKLADVVSDGVYNLGIRISDFLDVKTHLGGGDTYLSLTESLNAGSVVVFDTETTGTNTDSDEIIQIAAIKTDNSGNVLKELNLLVKSSKPVGDSFKVHGISDNDLAEKGIDKKTALIKLYDFIGDSVVVGHNVGFDIAILNSESERLNLPLKKITFYDTYLLAKRFIKNQKDYKLETLSKSLELKHLSSHDALDDVKATAYLLTHIVNEYILPTKEQRVKAVSPYLGLFKNLAYALEDYRNKLYELPFTEFLAQVVNGLKIRKIYGNSQDALFNIDYFLKIGNLINFKTHNSFNALKNFINVASLSTGDFDAIAKEQKLIPIITIHQSKGCEFNDVYIAGLAENVFPSGIAIKNNTVEEEKRLFYVAFTRAKNRVFLLVPENCYDNRGYSYTAKPSRFLGYIPDEYKKEC